MRVHDERRHDQEQYGSPHSASTIDERRIQVLPSPPMSSVLAIVSKGVFEKAAKDAKVGDLYETDAYLSKNKALRTLEDGGDLYLVTVRPGDVAWLVAVLRKPKFVDAKWKAKANGVSIRPIGKLIPKLTLENGKGIKPKPGRLGMSLQTPRALAAADVALLEKVVGSSAKSTVVRLPAMILTPERSSVS